MGDYQTGAWDEDAAENVAFDYLSKRAFVASAKQSTVQVVDLTNPTAPAQTGQIDVGSSLSKPARTYPAAAPPLIVCQDHILLSAHEPIVHVRVARHSGELRRG